MPMDLNELKLSLVGKIIESPDQCLKYAVDKSYLEPVLPRLVILPECDADIKAILAYANATKQSITVRGGGSGKSGGAIPEFDGIIISFEKMNAISEVDISNRCIVVEPGAILDDIKRVVDAAGLWYPVDPSSSDWCTIGGNVAENSGGANAIKYGVTRDYVLGLTGYFASGEPFSFGGACHKDVAGYDLKSLLVGSEGTLGIITKITLSLIPKPRLTQSFWCSFKTMSEACQFLNVMLTSSYHLSGAEFIQPDCLRAVSAYLDQDISLLKAPALLCRYDSDSDAGLEAFSKFLDETCLECNGTSMHGHDALYWHVRRSISEALGDAYKNKYSEDITVPVGSVLAYLEEVPLLEHKGTRIICYGHLGDGNIHTNILNLDLDASQWHDAKESMITEIMNLAIRLGGTLSGEHGIGLTKKAYMPLYFTNHELAIQKKIKSLFDPNNILNPSKIF